MVKDKKTKKASREDSRLMGLAGVMKEVGLVGFIVLVLTFIFLVWGTSTQKAEFIDRIILLKSANEDPYPCVIVVVTLCLLLMAGSIYFTRISKLRQQENNRIGKEKSALQEQLLSRKLNSSNDK